MPRYAFRSKCYIELIVDSSSGSDCSAIGQKNNRNLAELIENSSSNEAFKQFCNNITHKISFIK